MEEGVAVFNSDDILVGCNARIATLWQFMSGYVSLGVSWQDLVTAALRQGSIPEARGREDAWLERRRQLRGRYSAIQRTPDGHAYKVNERRISGSGIVAVWTDVTELLGEQAAVVPATHPNANLSDRQREVLKLVVLGLPMKAVALRLGISLRTVAFHKYRIMDANGLSSSADLLRFARHQGFLSAAETSEPIPPH